MSYSIKMPFILQEEIARLSNASDYELFILRCQIENLINTQQKLGKLSSQISVGSSLNYFDAQLLKEDTLFVTELGTLIKGIRQSDEQIICVELQSFNFDDKFKSLPNDEKRELINDEWQLPYYERVFVDCYSYVLKGYFIKYNHNGCKLKLLGGETVKLPSNALFYKPTENDIKDFALVENDPFQQNLEYERTLKIVQSKMEELDPSNNAIDYRKLVRFMTGRGYLLHYIEKAIEEIFGGSQDTCANGSLHF